MFNGRSLVGDVFGGVTASVIALPLALAFGVASGAGAQAGLYGAIILGFVAALLGGTRVQISGPTGPMTIVTASTLVLFQGNISLLMAVVLLTGLFQVLLGLLKVGRFVKYVPYPVISGFMSGIGVIIILLQINPLLGLDGVNSPMQAVISFTDLASGLAPETICLSLVALAIVFLTPKKIARMIPTPLLALILVTLLSRLAGWQVATIGDIPSGWPALTLPVFSLGQLSTIVASALSLALLGSIDSLLTSLVADSLTRTEHNPNRELIGQGVGNALVAFFGGIPGAGATMRTVVNVKSGGSTRLSGMLHALILAAILLGLGRYASVVPMAVLAAILIKVGIDIVDYRFIKIVRQAPRHDLVVMITVLLLTVFVDLIMAVGIGVILASVLLTIRVTNQVRSTVNDITVPSRSLADGENAVEEGGFTIRVVDVDGPFFFGSTSQLVGQVGQLLGTKAVIINFQKVPFIDLSAYFALCEIILKLKGKGTLPFLVANAEVKEKLTSLGITHVLREPHIYTDFAKAVEHAKEHVFTNRP